MAALMDDSAPMRLLQAAEKTFSDYSQDLGLFFGIQFLFFFVTPVGIMLWRLLWHWQEGFMTMFKAPIGRKGATRAPASALRFWLFNKTKYGYYMDVVQAAFSAISCIMFITVSYAAFDPEGVQVRCSACVSLPAAASCPRCLAHTQAHAQAPDLLFAGHRVLLHAVLLW